VHAALRYLNKPSKAQAARKYLDHEIIDATAQQLINAVALGWLVRRRIRTQKQRIKAQFIKARDFALQQSQAKGTKIVSGVCIRMRCCIAALLHALLQLCCSSVACSVARAVAALLQALSQLCCTKIASGVFAVGPTNYGAVAALLQRFTCFAGTKAQILTQKTCTHLTRCGYVETKNDG
jgi:hypothetical protein